MNIESLYQNQIKELSVVERLRLAKLIMDDLADAASDGVADSSDRWNQDDLYDLSRGLERRDEQTIAERAERAYAMASITLVLPEDLSVELELYRDNLEGVLRAGLREMRLTQGLTLYKSGAISLAKAARGAHVSLREMTQYAVAQGLRAAADEQTVQEELA